MYKRSRSGRRAESCGAHRGLAEHPQGRRTQRPSHLSRRERVRRRAPFARCDGALVRACLPADPRPQFEVKRVAVKGPPWDLKIAVEWRDWGHAADGVPYDNDGAHWIRIQRGKATYIHAYLDTARVTEPAGALRTRATRRRRSRRLRTRVLRGQTASTERAGRGHASGSRNISDEGCSKGPQVERPSMTRFTGTHDARRLESSPPPAMAGCHGRSSFRDARTSPLARPVPLRRLLKQAAAPSPRERAS